MFCVVSSDVRPISRSESNAIKGKLKGEFYTATHFQTDSNFGMKINPDLL